MTRARRLWAGAMVVASVVVLASVAVGASVVFATTEPDLPAISAEALLTSSLTALSKPVTISGDVKTRVGLGLPDLPSSLAGVAGVGGAFSNELTSLIGTQQYRVWSSPDGLRIEHPMDFQEQDLVANKIQAWFWDSASNTATKLQTANMASALAAQFGEQTTPTETMPPSPADVLGIARQALNTASTCGAVAVSGTSTVAGRPTYDLTFTPTSSTTLVGSITVTIDAQTRLPLDVRAVPRDSLSPALAAGFTSVSFAPIDASMFTFTPPADSTVNDVSDKVTRAIAQGPPTADDSAPTTSAPKPVTFGSCLDLRVAVPLEKPLPNQVASLLPMTTPLGSAMTIERGGRTWLLVGLVDAGTLEKDAASIP